MEDILSTYEVPSLCQQFWGCQEHLPCPPLCAPETYSLSGARLEADQRYWGKCHSMFSFAPDFPASVPVSFCHTVPMSCQNIPAISLLLYPNCISYMASSTQKQCKNPTDRVPEFGVWKMFTLQKATDKQLFCSVQQNGRLQPAA